MTIQPTNFRASAPSLTAASELGSLNELAGTWAGGGFNLIALPNHQNNKPFRLMLNATRETLEFIPIGGLIPNRGSSQNNLFMAGLTYLQQITDAETNQALHIEPGIWLNVPARTAPQAPNMIVRQSTIPHGERPSSTFRSSQPTPTQQNWKQPSGSKRCSAPIPSLSCNCNTPRPLR